MIVVADTSPIRYLVLLGHAELLPKLYGSVVIPGAVLAELTADRAPNLVLQFLSDIPQWLEVRALSKSLPPALLEILDQGESEAIELAIEIGADLLLIDERKGRILSQRVAASITLELSACFGEQRIAVGLIWVKPSKGWSEQISIFRQNFADIFLESTNSYYVKYSRKFTL